MTLYIVAEYLAAATYHSGITLFFRARGLTLGQISLLVALPPLVAMVAQPLWGALADRLRVKNTVLCILTAAAAISVGLYALPRGLIGMALAVAAYAVFATAVTPMSETILVQQLNEQGKPFGPLRLWGMAAFAVGGLVSGLVLGGDGRGFVWLATMAAALTAWAAWGVPKVPSCPREKETGRLVELLRNHDLLWMLLLVAALQMTQGMYFAFFPSLFTDTLGGSRALYGASVLVATISEAPFLLAADRLLKRLGAPKLLVLSGASMAAHWLLVALCRGVWPAFATQLLHAGGMVVLTFSMVKYVQQVVPACSRATGQMLSAVVGFGLARSAAGLLGRALSGRMPTISPIFFVMAGIAGLATALLARRLWRVKLAKGD